MKNIKTLVVVVTFLLGSSCLFAKPPVVEYFVNKQGGGIGALFNLYDVIDYDYYWQGDGYHVYLDCSGTGWSPCKVDWSNQISPPEDIPSNHWDSIWETLHDLNIQSEQEARDGKLNGSDSKVLAIELTDGNYVYYVCKAEWTYSEEDPTTGEVYLSAYKYNEYPPSF